MKIKFILTTTMLVGMLFYACNDEQDVPKQSMESGVAYVSVKVVTPTGAPETRASVEEPATTLEDKIHLLYAVAFDGSNNVIAYESTPPAQVVDISGSSQNPKSFCVSSNAKGLLLVANPGPKLLALLTGTTEGISFDNLNAAITSIKVDEIIDNSSSTQGFAMINSGNKLVASDTDATPNHTLSLIDITSHIEIVGTGAGEHATPQDAQTAAEANRIQIGVERLASKVILKEKTGGATTTNNATFTLSGWILDAVNTTFYPWAKKVTTGTQVTSGTAYVDNFYTIDPNYRGNTGIAYNQIVDYAPVVTWLTDGAVEYCVENTMQADEQRFKSATRIVIESTYYPDGYTGDWFSYGGREFEDLAALQLAYDDPLNVNLIAACDKFYTKVIAYLTDNSIPVTGIDSFADLTETLLAEVNNGGEVVKEDGCIRWYQDGLSYYWYEMRHDDAITAKNAFAKYGVVRNNWYELTVNSISKPGTPWYPSVDPDGGEKDPDPDDKIDEAEGYIGITLNVKPWIKWGHNIDI